MVYLDCSVYFGAGSRVTSVYEGDFQEPDSVLEAQEESELFGGVDGIVTTQGDSDGIAETISHGCL